MVFQFGPLSLSQAGSYTGKNIVDGRQKCMKNENVCKTELTKNNGKIMFCETEILAEHA